MDISLLLKPILLMNGVHDLRIRFDAEQRAVIATGTQYNQAFEFRQSFEELEALINGPGPAIADKAAAGGTPASDQGEIGQPERS